MAISLRDLAPFMVPFATATDRAEANARMFGIGDQRRRTGIMARQAEQAAELARQQLALDTKDTESLIAGRDAQLKEGELSIARQREADRQKREAGAFEAAANAHEALRSGNDALAELWRGRFESLGGQWKERQTPEAQRAQMQQALEEVMRPALAPPGPLAQPVDPALQLQMGQPQPAPSAFGLQLQPPTMQPMPEPAQQVPQAPVPMQVPPASMFPELQLQSPLAPPPAPPKPPRRVWDAYLGGKRIFTLDPQEAAAPNLRAREALDTAMSGIPEEDRAELGGFAGAIGQTQRDPAKAVGAFADIWSEQQKAAAAQARLENQTLRQSALAARQAEADERARRAEGRAESNAARLAEKDRQQFEAQQKTAARLARTEQARNLLQLDKDAGLTERANNLETLYDELEKLERADKEYDETGDNNYRAQVYMDAVYRIAKTRDKGVLSNQDVNTVPNLLGWFNKAEQWVVNGVMGDVSDKEMDNLQGLVRALTRVTEGQLERGYHSLKEYRNFYEPGTEEYKVSDRYISTRIGPKVGDRLEWWKRERFEEEQLRKAEAAGATIGGTADNPRVIPEAKTPAARDRLETAPVPSLESLKQRLREELK